MSVLQSLAFDEICSRGFIRDSDVARLRALFYSGSAISESEARALIELNRACPLQDASWLFFFAEAVAEFIVHEAEPAGSLTRTKAEWLTAEITDEGFVETRAELELLITALELSRWSTPALSALALWQVFQAVAEADGPLRGGSNLHRGTIVAEDVRMIRRILNAFAGDAAVAITKPEIEALLDIHSVIALPSSCPEWIDLLTRSVTNALLDASGYAVPQRHIALADRRLNGKERATDIAQPHSFRQRVAANIEALLPHYRLQSKEERAIARLERQRMEIITNEEILGQDAEWLIDRFFDRPEFERPLVAMLAALQSHGVALPSRFTNAIRARAGAA